ncbi:hypothetical protein AC249_AIPGENE13992, partial [Exaiptasia diaphana]
DEESAMFAGGGGTPPIGAPPLTTSTSEMPAHAIIVGGGDTPLWHVPLLPIEGTRKREWQPS